MSKELSEASLHGIIMVMIKVTIMLVDKLIILGTRTHMDRIGIIIIVVEEVTKKVATKSSITPTTTLIQKVETLAPTKKVTTNKENHQPTILKP